MKSFNILAFLAEQALLFETAGVPVHALATRIHQAALAKQTAVRLTSPRPLKRNFTFGLQLNTNAGSESVTVDGATRAAYRKPGDSTSPLTTAITTKFRQEHAL